MNTWVFKDVYLVKIDLDLILRYNEEVGELVDNCIYIIILKSIR
jgi:hypothetical protein